MLNYKNVILNLLKKIVGSFSWSSIKGEFNARIYITDRKTHIISTEIIRQDKILPCVKKAKYDSTDCTGGDRNNCSQEQVLHFFLKDKVRLDRSDKKG